MDQVKVLTIDNYDELKDSISSFDILLFRGDDIISDTIANLQGNDLFTHVGLAIKPDILHNYNLDVNKFYILESTFSYDIEGMNNGPPDVISNQKFFGVQLRDLESVVKSYNEKDKTKVFWLKRSTNFSGNFNKIFETYHKRPFSTNNIIDYRQITQAQLEVIKVFITKEFIEAWIAQSFTCVNLVSSIYKDIGCFDKNILAKYPYELLKEMLLI